jgi:hypothetical protein
VGGCAMGSGTWGGRCAWGDRGAVGMAERLVDSVMISCGRGRGQAVVR